MKSLNGVVLLILITYLALATILVAWTQRIWPYFFFGMVFYFSVVGTWVFHDRWEEIKKRHNERNAVGCFSIGLVTFTTASAVLVYYFDGQSGEGFVVASYVLGLVCWMLMMLAIMTHMPHP